MTQAKTISNPTAASAYADRHDQAKKLVEQLVNALGNHHTKARSEPVNWCFVGDMGNFNHLARQALEALGPITA